MGQGTQRVQVRGECQHHRAARYNHSMDIAVVGAGPAGIMAALQASRGGAQVTLFDHNARIGRKLLVTGSGRCNLTNQAVSPSAYYGPSTAWMSRFLSEFTPTDLLRELVALGAPAFATSDGWYYPLSESAQALTAILEEALARAGVRLRLSTHISAFSRVNERFRLQIGPAEQRQEESFDALVAAAGGRAYPELGARGELFDSLARLGHTVRPLLPALGPIHASLGAFQALQGLRFDAQTAILEGGQPLAETQGNLIVTASGFNGPGVMNLSHWPHLRPGRRLTLRINFLGSRSADFDLRLAARAGSALSLQAFLWGWLPPKAAQVFLSVAGLKGSAALSALDELQAERLRQALTGAEFTISSGGTFRDSQVTVGGVPAEESAPQSCRSMRVPGLYLVGETLDVAGPCGGFNLHFAFGSGYLAGRDLAAPANLLDKERT